MRKFLFGLMVGATSPALCDRRGSTSRFHAKSIGIAMMRPDCRSTTVMRTVPVSDRKALFRGLSASMKASVWIAHLDNFSSTHALSPAQEAVINDAKSLLVRRSGGLYE